MNRALILLFAAALLLLLLPANQAPAQSFAATDLQTVFYIAKSDDRNRVDYGMRVDASCQPVGEHPMFAYWRRFEPGQTPLGQLNSMDSRVYGIASQSVSRRSASGSWVEMHLAGFSQVRVLVLVVPQTTGGCTARARAEVEGVDLLIDHLFAQLGGLLGIQYVTVVGEEVSSGRHRSVRLTPPGL